MTDVPDGSPPGPGMSLSEGQAFQAAERIQSQLSETRSQIEFFARNILAAARVRSCNVPRLQTFRCANRFADRRLTLYLAARDLSVTAFSTSLKYLQSI